MPHPKGGSAAPYKNGKATNLSPDQTKLITNMSRQNNKAPKSNMVQHQPKKTLITCFKCKKEDHHMRNCILKKEEKDMSKISKKRRRWLMSSAPTWGTMPLCVPTRLITKPHFQRTR
jgi:hypothetical protein